MKSEKSAKKRIFSFSLKKNVSGSIVFVLEDSKKDICFGSECDKIGGNASQSHLNNTIRYRAVI